MRKFLPIIALLLIVFGISSCTPKLQQITSDQECLGRFVVERTANGMIARCETITETPSPIPSDTPTSTDTPTETPTLLPSDTPTLTNTPIVPTLTPTTIPPTVPVPTSTVRTLNMPYQCLSSGALFTPAVAWFGRISPSDNYSDIRVYCADDNSIKIAVHIIDRLLWYDTTPSLADLTQWDSVSLIINNAYKFDGQLSWFEGRSAYQASYVNGAVVNSPFITDVTWRGESPNADVENKGWSIVFNIPYTSLGISAKPLEGTVYKLEVITHDRDSLAGPSVDTSWSGNLRFGVPVYNAPAIASDGVKIIYDKLNGAHVVDGEVGGHTICGDDMISDFWRLWGNRNYAGNEQVNVQNQWDVSDWPCFSKFYITFPLNSLPQGTQIISATYQMYLFGTSGWGQYGTPPDSYIQAFVADSDWSESTLTWNNAPQAIENVSGVWVKPLLDPNWVLYKWDISRAVADAYAKGKPLRLVFYSGDGERHTGRYFISSDTSDYNATLGVRPQINISYGSGVPISTPTPTSIPVNTPTETPTQTPTDTPTLIVVLTDTSTPTATATPRPTATPTRTPIPTIVPTSSTGMTYYISPTGNDSNSGTTETQAWATFNHAWPYLYPGDTLIMLDGTYYQTLRPNIRNGQPGKYITVKAKNDGKAVIDGQYVRAPVILGGVWPGPIGSYFDIEGIVAKNSNDNVYMLQDGGNNNILRRVSGYNANTDENSHVFSIWGYGNLIEDAIAQGTGRKMFMFFMGGGNTARRVFAMWDHYDGRNFLQCWPWGDGIEIYNSSNNIIENSVAYGRIPMYMISLLAQGNPSTNNQFLGVMGIMSGMNYDMTPMRWPPPRPQPTSYTCVAPMTNGGERAGFQVYETNPGYAANNVWKDIFAWGNASWAFNWQTDLGPYRDSFPVNPLSVNNTLDHATFINNGLDNMDGPYPGQYGGKNIDVTQVNMTRFASITNSIIDRIFIGWPNYPDPASKVLTSMTGEGARLKYRYVNGTMMDGTNGTTTQNLWPWPMEQRGLDELGISITNILTQKIFGTTDLTVIYP